MSTQTLEKIHPSTGRVIDHPVNSVFVDRWSPRAFTGEAIPDETLFTALEAARWAPSGGNSQPWRFIYSKKGSASWAAFLSLLNPNNQRWAEKASALVLFVSQKHRTRNGEVIPTKSHSFDTGAAAQNFNLQALLLGWHTHGIGGYDHEKARVELGIPEEFALESFWAIGKQADKESLPEDLRQREIPNDRLPLKELAHEGKF